MFIDMPAVAAQPFILSTFRQVTKLSIDRNLNEICMTICPTSHDTECETFKLHLTPGYKIHIFIGEHAGAGKRLICNQLLRRAQKSEFNAIAMNFSWKLVSSILYRLLKIHGAPHSRLEVAHFY